MEIDPVPAELGSRLEGGSLILVLLGVKKREKAAAVVVAAAAWGPSLYEVPPTSGCLGSVPFFRRRRQSSSSQFAPLVLLVLLLFSETFSYSLGVRDRPVRGASERIHWFRHLSVGLQPRARAQSNASVGSDRSPPSCPPPPACRRTLPLPKHEAVGWVAATSPASHDFE